MENTKVFAKYEDFGAIGDGINDDFAAIVACHEWANANSVPVRARDGAHYYLGGAAISAKIMTDTNFGTARFTIDDRSLENRESHCFEIVSAAKVFVPEIKEMKKGQKKINFPHNGTVYVRIEGDPNHRVYIRKGLNKNSGSVPAEAFIVDDDGNILTDINWDYPTISAAMAKSVDDEPITVEGGIFTTIANQWVSRYDAHNRGFSITRSNVTVENVTHYVEGELVEHGAPYSGFFNIGKSYNVTLRNVTLTPHYTYMTESKVPGQLVSMGTYDLLLTNAIGAKLIGIRQTIEIDKRQYWGLMGSNFCKDMELTDCVISRFDAHCGITNCRIKGCDFGIMGMNLIGFGSFSVEDTTVRASHLICFRPDYGSSFNGVIKLKNCTWIPYNFGENLDVFTADNSGDHYFGYDCVMAREIRIENLTILDTGIDEKKELSLLPIYDKNYTEGKPYALILPKKITMKNVKTATGREIIFAKRPELYSSCELVKI